MRHSLPKHTTMVLATTDENEQEDVVPCVQATAVSGSHKQKSMATPDSQYDMGFEFVFTTHTEPHQ